MYPHNLTSNQYYRGVNKRFDKRARQLHRAGYRYTHTEYGAVFVRERYGRKNIVNVSVVNFAPNVAFYAVLSSRGR